MAEITLRVNGAEHHMDIDPRTSLLDLLRERLRLTGSKKGCDHGQCGACTVLIDGRRANSAWPWPCVRRRRDTTVEGLADGDALHPLQTRHPAGRLPVRYCTPGQLCSAAGMLPNRAPAR